MGGKVEGSVEEEVGQAGVGKVGWGAGRGLKAELAGLGGTCSVHITACPWCVVGSMHLMTWGFNPLITEGDGGRGWHSQGKWLRTLRGYTWCSAGRRDHLQIWRWGVRAPLSHS